MLWITKITFTGSKPIEGKTPLQRPRPTTIVVKAKDLDEASKKIAGFANTKWRGWRFEITRAGCSKVL